ncbi:MAG: NAD-dependent epimerase/dehydratase family protein [Halieaceae bacterium]|mgnify:FL=1|nr:NAD-dependent epimerase/dehydratase family protein [Halieaceae bacterium]
MKILVVGGTGLIGGHVALELLAAGHDVTLMARKPPSTPALSAMPFVSGDYVLDDFSDGRLEGFDALIFAAAVDIRYLPRDGSETPEAFYRRCNSDGVPRFIKAAKSAGIPKVVYVGSFYPQIAPQRISECPYVESRHLADEGARALASSEFSVCSVNAPYVLGALPGLEIEHLSVMVAYARGQLENLPLFAPPGGTNHLSVKSLSQALIGALAKGESGKAYLVGDENYSWKDYLELWCSLAGNPMDLEVRTEDHPLLPNVIMFAGVGATVSYEPDPDESRLLNYSRSQIKDTISEVIDVYG